MHPNTFLKTLWRPDIRNEVFVAMSFDNRYDSRYSDVIVKAIESIAINEKPLISKRVDESKTGDSILTDILDGIAHSKIVLVDVSVIGKNEHDSTTIRNGNVMYELGLALATRGTTDVIIIRDDNEKFLFDISTIPHHTIDFSDNEMAKKQIADLLYDRINEQKHLYIARSEIFAKTINEYEFTVLKNLSTFNSGQSADLRSKFSQRKRMTQTIETGINGLISKGLIRVTGQTDDGGLWYQINDFGRSVLALAKEHWPIIEPENKNG